MVLLAVAMTVLLSLTMIGLGYLFTRRPPRKINGLYGYRTARSMKSQAAWDFAHRYAGRVWIRCGLVNAAVSAVLIVALRDSAQFEYFVIWLTVVQLVILMAVIPITERALARNFDRDGMPRA